MSRFGTLAEFDFNHLDLRFAGLIDKALGAEAALVVAATEVARTYFPDQVAAVYAVVARDRALAGVVRKAAHFGALVQGHDGVGAERAKAHGRHIEQADVVGLAARGVAYMHAKVGAGYGGRRHGMG